MTREEAIAFFKDMNECTYGNLEAVEMAIKALEQEPILDKIRAEIEPTRKMYLDMNDIDWLNGCDYVLSLIDKYKGESEDKDMDVNNEITVTLTEEEKEILAKGIELCERIAIECNCNTDIWVDADMVFTCIRSNYKEGKLPTVNTIYE